MTQKHVASIGPEHRKFKSLTGRVKKLLPLAHAHSMVRGQTTTIPVVGTIPVQNQVQIGLDSRMRTALERLRRVLKFMTAEERRSAIVSLPPRMRTALLTFMEHAQTRQETPTDRKRKADSIHGDENCKSLKGTDVRTIQTVYGTRHVAQLRLEHLRFYTCGQPSAEHAARHRMIFAHFRNAVEAIGEAIWDDPTRFCLLFEDIVREHNTSKEEMGLGVLVYMRADQWIDRAQAITSPRLPLADAVVLHARLVRACATSWEDLRREWAPLLCCTQRQRRAGRLSLAQAEAVAEQAHRRHAKKRLGLAVARLERCLSHMDKSHTAKAKRRAREHGRALAKKAADARRAQTKQRQSGMAKFGRLSRSGFTMRQVPQGLPITSSSRHPDGHLLMCYQG